MREIKFRALMNPEWTEKTYWIYGEADYRSDFKENEMPLEKFHRHIRANRALRETMTEFTGLLDKQGKEIYEGDIIKTNATNAFVHYDECCFWIEGKNKAKSRLCQFKTYSIADDDYFEVIGNIYENPDLLEAR